MMRSITSEITNRNISGKKGIGILNSISEDLIRLIELEELE